MDNKRNALPAGTRLKNGEYVIERTLGAGGFGLTYKVVGYVGNIRQNFAVKEFFLSTLCLRQGNQMVYPPQEAQRVEDALRSFFSEAKRFNDASLHHPNIVGINEVFRENGTVYYVMEYVRGRNIREFVKAGRQFSEEDVRNIMTPLMSALSMMHDNRIVHFDIKPDNILLSLEDDGNNYRPVIIDFGLSRHYGDNLEITTDVEFSALSKGYAPCEQYTVDGLNTFNPQADVYALAATMLFMLTGNNPLPAHALNTEILQQQIPAYVSENMRNALVHAMQPLQQYRTPSIRAFAQELGINIDAVGYGYETQFHPIEHDPGMHNSGRDFNSNPLISDQVNSGQINSQQQVPPQQQFPPQPPFPPQEPYRPTPPMPPMPPTPPEPPKSKLKWIIIGVLAILAIAACVLVAIGSGDDTSSAKEPKTGVEQAPRVDNGEDKSGGEIIIEEDQIEAPAEKVDDAKPNDNATAIDKKDEEYTKEPKPVPEKPKEVDNQTRGALNLGYGMWDGEINNGKANGYGTVKYTRSHTVGGHEVELGYTFRGVYTDGKPTSGKIYDREGNLIATVVL